MPKKAKKSNNPFAKSAKGKKDEKKKGGFFPYKKGKK